MDNDVEKLHRALVSAIRQARGNDFTQPVTVSEIYQQLVPYRTARAVVGFDMNADYEYALLRLLAGEGDFARLEPAEVREMLRGELELPNPNVSMFREFANCDVWISAPPPWLSDVLAEPELEIPPDEEPEITPIIADETANDDAPAAGIETPPPPPPQPPAARPAAPRTAEPPSTTPAAPAPAAAPAAAHPADLPAQRCSGCGFELPPGRVVNFCPFCGNDLTRRLCPSCGEVLEPGWRFCANCGTATGRDAGGA